MEKTFSRDRLIIFGRYPVPGNTKTRLIPALGPVGAAGLQRHLTEKTFLTAKEFATRHKTTLECCFEGGTPQKIRRWLGPVPILSFQKDGDLGRRMRVALFAALNEGNKRVVLLGTDIPGLNVQILKNAFDALREHDIVLGPSTDGGYWLMGLKRPIDLFQQIDWSTPRVLDQTRARARHMGLTVHLLKYLSDVDTPEDFRRLRLQKNVPEIFLSVVIPAFNEENYIHRAILSATDRDVEVIVVDGGSTDRTVSQAESLIRAQSLNARVIRSPSGRARQQNCGAAAARGENLLFLHADTRLPEGYVTQVFETLMASGRVLGAFRFKTDFHHPLMRFVEWMTHLRSRYLRLPYGDQAIFMKKSVFERAGGFPVVPIGEDLLLVRHLIKHEKAQVLPATGVAVTSGRRWKTVGLLKTTWINLSVLAGMAMGISLQTLSRLYRRSS
ncbi:MAG: TIGR04283 family arsenosugar biosynthesis glycosyltransferase [Deltaproteobacteria bacterium]|nr:TIGR04283 family arsenosugar biosynthesis glycosyltransferase [Deltaproteobacteria bacterium]